MARVALEYQGERLDNDYPVHDIMSCSFMYIDPRDIDLWLCCPRCKLKPKIWSYNNGRQTACGCWNNEYDYFSVHAESVMSHRTNSTMLEYDQHALRNNWNHWVKTGLALFIPTKERW